VTQNYGGRIIFWHKRAYHFGQIGFWRPHHFRAQTAVSFRTQTAVTSPHKIGRRKQCVFEQYVNSKKIEKTFFVPQTKEKNEKQIRSINPFFYISRRWLNCSWSDYAPPNAPWVASVLQSDFLRNRNAYATLFFGFTLFLSLEAIRAASGIY